MGNVVSAPLRTKMPAVSLCVTLPIHTFCVGRPESVAEVCGIDLGKEIVFTGLAVGYARESGLCHAKKIQEPNLLPNTLENLPNDVCAITGHCS